MAVEIVVEGGVFHKGGVFKTEEEFNQFVKEVKQKQNRFTWRIITVAVTVITLVTIIVFLI